MTALTLDAVAAELDCTYEHVWRLVRRGKLRAKNIGTAKKRIWRVPVEEFERYLAADDEPQRVVPVVRLAKLPKVTSYV